MNIVRNNIDIHFFTIPSDNNCGNSSFKVAYWNVQPLIDQGLVMEILSSIQFSLAIGKVSDNGVGWEECSFGGLE